MTSIRQHGAFLALATWVTLASATQAVGQLHTADYVPDGDISLSELLRGVQHYNLQGIHCDAGSEDGYAPGSAPTLQGCAPHHSDYAPQDWVIGLTELLRLIQLYHADSYAACPGAGTEDGFCPTFGGGEEPGDGSPPWGNPDGTCAIPPEAHLEDVSMPDHIVGMGTPESCTGEAFISAVAQGGTIVFDCGPDPVTINLEEPAKVFNNQNPDVVIDGGGLVTLSGGGTTRILYMNTCDPDQVWTTPHCQNQDHPRLTVQNLTFVDGNSANESEYEGGGAIWVRGGRFKVVNCRFFNNVCADTGPDVGGGAIRVFSQYQGLPVYVVNSTFGGGQGFGNAGSNGGGISSIGVSWTLINCLFTHNRATGNGGNPAQPGTPGGGSGGAIYNDGNTMTLSVCGTLIEHNEVNAFGAAIFFVTNNRTGELHIDRSVIRNNLGGSWHLLPGISMHSDTVHTVTDSTIE